MKKQLFFVVLIAGQSLAQEINPAEIGRVVSERRELSLCTSSVIQQNNLRIKINNFARKGRAETVIADKMRQDVAHFQDLCTDGRLSPIPFGESFPQQIFDLQQSPKALFAADALALDYLKTKESSDCPELSAEAIYDVSRWHELLLGSGWTCSARNFLRQSAEMNATKGYGQAQIRLNQLSALSFRELKALFKLKFDRKEAKFAFAPQLLWENGALDTAFPYSLLTDSTELTSYRRLLSDFRKLGYQARLLERNSMKPMDEQVRETSEAIKRLDGPHIVIGRSMGSRVMREVLVQNDPAVMANMRGFFNVGGTPHGSVIAAYKSRPEVFYYNVVPTVLDALKMPVNLIALDPRIPNHLRGTMLSALDRQGLSSMAMIEPRFYPEITIPVVNAVMIRPDFQRSTQNVDPVWAHMLQYGPTEGSSPLAGAALDTPTSLRLTVDNDHLAFWKLSPKEAFSLFLKLLIVAEENGLLP